MKLLALATALTASVIMATGAVALDLDPELPAYKAVRGLSGPIKSVGSDTLSTLMEKWADGFKALYPSVTIEIESKGSSTAPPALLEGTSQLGPMSRSMSSEEITAFDKKFAYGPASTPVAVDALAVYVNKDNPIECLTLQQVDQIFSKDHWNSWGVNVETWGGVGLTGDWATRPIALFGRNSASGTYETFKKSVLREGEFKDALKEQPDSPTSYEWLPAISPRSDIPASGISRPAFARCRSRHQLGTSATTLPRNRQFPANIRSPGISTSISTRTRSSLSIGQSPSSSNTCCRATARRRQSKKASIRSPTRFV